MPSFTLMRRHGPLLALLPLLAACATTPQPGPPPPPPRPGTIAPPPTAPVPAPPPVAGFRVPDILRGQGLEQVLQQDARALMRTFGTPRLDVHEGDMRKLQFTADACVMDVYLYPLRPGAEPVVTHIETRRASDGAAVDRPACINALRR